MSKVLHGDCLELMHGIPDGSVDMILCDLPYGTTACSWDTIIPFEPLWSHYKRLIKPNGAIVLTASQPFTSKLVMSNLDMFKYCWVWEKTRHSNFLLVKTQPMRKHEDIIIFYKSQPTYNPQKVKGIPYIDNRKEKDRTFNTTQTTLKNVKRENDGWRYPSSIQRFSNPNNNSVHPTQKPLALFEYLIRTYTNAGDTVLDNCAGSGTTGVACERTDRNYILIEQEQKYIDIINKRIEQETAQGKLF